MIILTTIKYSKLDERTGKYKNIREVFAVDAQSFTEAEARATTYAANNIIGFADIKALRFAPYNRVVETNEDTPFFDVRVAHEEITEKGATKRYYLEYLVQAPTLLDAIDTVEEEYKGSVDSWLITGVKESAVVAVLRGERADND